MGSEISPDVSQSTPPGLQLGQTQRSSIPDIRNVHITSQDVVPGSLPKNVDTKTRQVEPSDQCELAANDEDDLIPAGMKIDGIFGRKLEDRISGLEQRLCEAGLLEKPEFESDSRKIPEEKGDSECPELPSPRNVLGSLVHANLSTGSPKNTTNQEDYLRVLVGRIDSLEKRLEEAGHLKTKAGLENHRMPAIPQLQYLQWSDFKNKLASKEETYAIEVLVGGAKYWYQQSEEDDNNRQRSDYHSNGHDESAIEVSNPAPSPERIRINSKPMLLIMKSIDPAGWNELPTVVLWPFKPLIYHEVRIREVFERLLSRWGNSPMEGIDSWRMRNEDTEDMTDSFEALQDLRCLLKFIDLELRPVVESFRGNTRKKVLFRDLWHLFKPGDLVYSPLGNRDPLERSIKDVRYQEVFRIVRTVGGRNLLGPSRDCDPKNNVSSLHVEVYWADFSGTQFVPQYTILTLLPYHGEREITSLGFYPLRYSPKADELQSKWKSRGEAFRDYTVFKYRYFTGKSLISSPDGGFANIPGDSHPKIAEIIDSQVVVDFGEAFAAHRAWRTDTSGPELKPADCYPEWTEKYPTSYWKDSDWKILDKKSDDRIYEDVIIDARLIEEWREQDPLLRKDPWTKSAGKVDFDKDYLILLPNRVFAFVMKSRKWSILPIDGLRPVKRYDGGLHDLQLPTGHKRTIWSLVQNHFTNKNMEQDGLEARHDADLVRGKGKGLIILLHGAPGVGKTSTAETVADAFGKLLFPITCGDLGLTAADVERELSQKFHLAELWGCVLLLDEADVFLARRTNTDIKRNSSVSVFLRVLEHFTGVLFLTTNRVGAFDEAFKSRIHLSLYYPPLDAEQTRNIWKVNLERLIKKKQRRHESMLFDEKEILAYAQNHYTRTIQRGASWNGRQIRNAFQTASSLAEFEAHEQNTEAKARSAVTGEKFVRCDPHLRVGHFKEIAKASYEFDKYISETKGFTDAEIAYREGQRMDEYQAYRSPVRDREKQLKQSRETSTLLSAPMQGPGPQLKARRAPTAQASAGRIGSVYPRSPVAFTQDIPEAQASEHDQRPARTETRSVNTYGTPTTIARTGDKRSSAAHSRPKTSQQQSTLMAQDQERQQYEVLDEYATQYNDGHEDGEDLEYEPSYENPSSQPMNTRIHFDDRNQRQTSPRHRQFGDFPTRSQKSAFFDYGDNLEDDEDNFDG